MRAGSFGEGPVSTRIPYENQPITEVPTDLIYPLQLAIWGPEGTNDSALEVQGVLQRFRAYLLKSITFSVNYRKYPLMPFLGIYHRYNPLSNGFACRILNRVSLVDPDGAL